MSKKRPSLHLFRFADDFLSYGEGQIIFKEAQDGDTMYVVKSGDVVLEVEGRALEVVEAGGIFGEMAIIEKKPRSATAKAKTACEIVELDEERFRYLVQKTPTFAIEVMRVMADRIRTMDAKLSVKQSDADASS